MPGKHLVVRHEEIKYTLKESYGYENMQNSFAVSVF